MKSRRWVVSVAGTYCIILVVIAVLVIVVDPYFHFHAPIEGIAYEMEESQYMNDGITKNFDYDTIITGASTTEAFSTAVIDELFDAESVRLTFSGEGFKRVNENIETAIDTHPDLKLIIRGIDPLWFMTEEDYMGYDSYPEYLYDDDWWNDVYYVLNGDVLCGKVFPEIWRTLRGEPAKGFDDYVSDRGVGRETVFGKYDRVGKQNGHADEKESEQIFLTLDKNLQKNVIEVIEENPDITFYLFIPPYSILWWDQFHQYGDEILDRRIRMEEYAIKKLLPYDNVRLFAFTTNTEWICDFEHYRDDVHFAESASTQVLEWIKAGKYELTEDNYEAYIDDITDFLHHYDYDALFED